MEVLRLDALYSNEDGSLKDPAAYIVQGLCRRCCLPEVILRCMQVNTSLRLMMFVLVQMFPMLFVFLGSAVFSQ